MTYSTLLLSEITDQDAVGGKARGLAALLAAGFAEAAEKRGAKGSVGSRAV